MVQQTEAEILTAVLLVHNAMAFAHLDVVIVPPRHLVWLTLGQPPSSSRVEKGGANQTTADQVNGVVMAKVHCRPPDPTGVGDEEDAKLGKAVAHKEGLQDSISSVQRRKGAKGQRGGCEIGRVKINAEDGIHACESCRRTGHVVGGRDEAVFVLIPRRCTGEEQLNGDTEKTHPAKGAGKDGCGARGSKDEHQQGAHSRSAKVHDAVGKPSENVENGVFVSREDVGQVCPV